MTRLGRLGPALALGMGVVLAGCTDKAKPISEIRDPGTTPSSLQQVVLLDVQGLWGGQDIWISQSGEVVVRKVSSTGNESRWRSHMTPDEWTELRATIGRDNLRRLEIPKHPVGPDENHPTLALMWSDGTFTRVTKPGHDKVPRFDAAYGWILKWEEKAKPTGTPETIRIYDWNWVPEGFSKPPSPGVVLDVESTVTHDPRFPSTTLRPSLAKPKPSP